MGLRSFIGFTLIAALLVVLGLFGWHVAADYSATKSRIDELSTNVNLLISEKHEATKGAVTQKVLDEFRERVVAGERDRFEQLQKLKAELQETNQRLAQAGASVAQVTSLKEKLIQIEKDLQVTNEVVKDMEGRKDNLGDLKALGQPQKQNGEVTPPSPPPSTPPPQSGTLRINNKMPSWQDLEVNGIPHWVEPLSYRDVRIPTGSVTTRLVGYEAAKRWPIEAPNYFQTVIIEPSYGSSAW